MRIVGVAVLSVVLGLACGTEPPPAPVPETLPEPTPPPAEQAPTEEAPAEPEKMERPASTTTPKRPTTEVKQRPDADAKPKADPKPAGRGTVTIKGDAKTVVLLGDGNDRQYKDGGEVIAGAYKVKAWYTTDPVPQVATSVTVTAGENVTVTCSSKEKWCREGDHAVPSMDTGSPK